MELPICIFASLMVMWLFAIHSVLERSRDRLNRIIELLEERR